MKDPSVESVGRALEIPEEEIDRYPSSRIFVHGVTLQMVRIRQEKMILVTGTGKPLEIFHGQRLDEGILLCPLTHENRLALNHLLPFTLPVAFGRRIATFGVGDRLGLATPGHLSAFAGSKAKPILAQQSKRELTLTGRNYRQVLDDVCFAVFQEGYRGGFGADGDHLKTKEDIEVALDEGYTMITLDCSDAIGRGVEQLTLTEAEQSYHKFPDDYRERIEGLYLNSAIQVGSKSYLFTREDLVQCVLLYGKAIAFVEEIYRELIVPCARQVDFELSIDETESVTTGLGHLFVGLELVAAGIEVTSLAPRFVGEFQKGIDYIGDLKELEGQLEQHADIADHFGYKLSIHSGSDKFSTFPLIGKATKGRLHVKTSGTNWLEAVRTIAVSNPDLYRRMHRAAMTHFEESRLFYHVSAELTRVPDLDQMSDANLPRYLEENASRQMLHITYGFLLRDEALREAIYHELSERSPEYMEHLVRHIGRHLDDLGLRRIR